MAYDKSLAKFEPLRSRTLAECEQHYFTHHYPWAREWLSASPSVVSYHVGRAAAELRGDGTWSDEPSAWRFILLRYRPGARPTHSAERAEQIAQDHRNCLRDLRSCSVREEFLLGSNSRAATGPAKFLFEYERSSTNSSGAGAGAGADRFAGLVDRLRMIAASAAGLTTLIADSVLSEGATEAIDEPGQRALPRRLDKTTKVGYLEFYFDGVHSAEQWFSSATVRDLLLDPYFEVARGYRIEENCGFDKRPQAD